MTPACNSIFEAALPQPYRVLGIKLKPFCLGHYLLLRRHGCAFVADEQARATREDLIFAVLVCSQSFDEFQSWINDGKVSAWEQCKELARFATFRSSTAEMLAAFGGRRWQYETLRIGRAVGLFDLKEKCELFQRYLEEHTREPKVWFEKEPTTESGSHWSHSVFVVLTGNLGFTRDQALSMPLHEALLHYFKHAENNGIVTLMTAEEIPQE